MARTYKNTSDYATRFSGKARKECQVRVNRRNRHAAKQELAMGLEVGPVRHQVDWILH